MILVHACCGPCAVTVLQTLLAGGEDVAVFYHNPNIHPLGEYLRRKEALQEVCRRLDAPLECDDAGYDPALFLRLTAFRENARCPLCYRLRLDRAARRAAELGAHAFTTTLLYSRYQDHQAIRDIGEACGAEHGVALHYRDFREGWDEGVRLSKEWGLYRQPYCGCIHSEFDRYRKRLGR
uniref:Epoxyqueuosine reductase QueH n=1 Tax=Fundidesulfovibrio putealis TaxID=270496 RepID=A0A7C4EJ09_9BACT